MQIFFEYVFGECVIYDDVRERLHPMELLHRRSISFGIIYFTTHSNNLYKNRPQKSGLENLSPNIW